MTRRDKILAVPTNIVTGFLGAGKTSAILNLLAQKPSLERWAILVNEFGEIGVDGALYAGQYSEENGVYISEVPGGCMCCSASLPMQIALNRLLQRARPHRLFIEPTGLGHPVEVLEILSSDSYREILSIEKILTLVDARNLDDERYTGHPTFNQQLAIADLVIGNKNDLYRPEDRRNLTTYVARHAPANTAVMLTEQGLLEFSLLTGKTGVNLDKDSIENLIADAHPAQAAASAQDNKQREGFQSISWQYSPQCIFDRQKLLLFFGGLRVERLKAVFITSSGVFAYNLAKDTLKEMALDDATESCIDIIASQIDAEWEAALANCIDGSPD